MYKRTVSNTDSSEMDPGVEIFPTTEKLESIAENAPNEQKAAVYKVLEQVKASRYSRTQEIGFLFGVCISRKHPHGEDSTSILCRTAVMNASDTNFISERVVREIHQANDEKLRYKIGDEIEVTWTPSLDCPIKDAVGGTHSFVIVPRASLAGNMSVGVKMLEKEVPKPVGCCCHMK